MNYFTNALATSVVATAVLVAGTVAHATPQINDPECKTRGNYTMCIAEHESLPGYVVFTSHDRTTQDYYVQITDCNQSRYRSQGSIKGIDKNLQVKIAQQSCKKYNLVPSTAI